MGVLRSEGGRQVDTYFRQRADAIHRQAGPAGSVWSVVDAEFAEPGGQGPADANRGGQPWSVVERLRDELDAAARAVADRFRSHLFALVDQSPRHLDAAAEAFGDFLARLDDSRAAVSGVLDELTQELAALRTTAPAPSPPGGLDSPVHQYALLRFCEHTYRCVLRHASAVAALLRSLPDELRQLRQELRALEAHLPARAAGSNGEPLEADATRPLAAFDERIRTNGRFLATALAEDVDPAELMVRLRDEARLFLVMHASQPQPGRSGSPKSGEDQLGELARPRLSRLGGGRRVLAVVPDSSQAEPWRSRLVEIYGECVSVLTDPTGGLFVCCEDQDIPLSAVRPALCGHRLDLAEMASRLHTRIDIEW
jgi:hypothetical protein